MRCKKVMIGCIVLLVFCIWGYFVYRVNAEYPNPKHKAYEAGDVTQYKGLNLTVGSAEVYSYGEFVNAYPQVKSAYDKFGEQGGALRNDMMKYNIVVAHATLENPSDRTIDLGKERVTSWKLEVENESNGCSQFEFDVLNPTYSTTVKAHEKQDVIFVFSLLDEFLTLEELKCEDVKIVFSYYPTKSYMLFKAADRGDKS